MENDPLEGLGLEVHECDRGWKWVGHKYAEHLAAQVHIEGKTPPEAIVAALLNSVYPCRDCQPVRFVRWAEGHFARDHDPGGCRDCIAVHGGKPSSRRYAKRSADTSAGPPPLTDLDEPVHQNDEDPWKERADLA